MKIPMAAILLLNIFLLDSCVDNRNASEVDTTTQPEAPKDSLGNPKMIMDNDLMHALSGTMAKQMTLDQNSEIEEFKAWLINHK